MLLVNIRAMADFDDGHFFFGIIDDVNDTVIILAYAITFLMAGQRFTARRPGLRRQRPDLLNKLREERLWNGPQLSLGAPFDQDLIGGRHASNL